MSIKLLALLVALIIDWRRFVAALNARAAIPHASIPLKVKATRRQARTGGFVAGVTRRRRTLGRKIAVTWQRSQHRTLSRTPRDVG